MRVSINDIQTNMIVDQDVYNDKGELILSKGLSIADKEKIKEILLKNNIEKIKVLLLGELPTKNEKIYNYTDEKQEDIKVFINEFNNTVNEFKDEISKTLTGQGDLNNLENMLEDAIKSNFNKNTNVFQLLQKLKDSDDMTFVHCNSVSLTAYAIGNWLKLSKDELKDLSLAGLLFDVGKYYIPKEILTKKEPLNLEEFELIKTHVDKSLDILKSYNLNENIINAIKFHHERCDGSGYPYGLKGDRIPFMAKIIALSDIFVALTSQRPHRKKYTPFEAIKILETDYMQKLDIVILSEFIKRIASNYIGNAVKLSNGLEGEILFINATSPLKPIIKINSTGDLFDLSSKSNSQVDIQEFL